MLKKQFKKVDFDVKRSTSLMEKWILKSSSEPNTTPD